MNAIDLPKTIPVFPLSGVIFFPNTNLPLNIFEPKYLALISDCMKLNSYMGMIQTKNNNSDIYSVGCLGRITECKTTNDGRVLINLIGVCRYEIKSELANNKLYREFSVSYKKFSDDLSKTKKEENFCNDYDNLHERIKLFFKKNGLLLDWNEFEKLDKNQKINTLAMISPISNVEKQSILESIYLHSKIKSLLEIINFYLHQQTNNKFTLQ
jgi:Lon protease-like protein